MTYVDLAGRSGRMTQSGTRIGRPAFHDFCHDLRAEARAWREEAQRMDRASEIGTLPAQTTVRRSDLWFRLNKRYMAHLAMERCDGPATWDSLVLFCLFLALECEDEARALGRGKTPDLRSGR